MRRAYYPWESEHVWRAMYEGTWADYEAQPGWWYTTEPILNAEYDPVKDVWFVPEIFVGVDWAKSEYEIKFHGAMEASERPTRSRTNESTGMEIVLRS